MLLEDQIPYIMKYEAIWIQQVRDKRKSAFVPWAALCATWNPSVTEVKGSKPWHTVNTVVSHSSYAKSVARICQNFLCRWIATQFGDYLGLSENSVPLHPMVLLIIIPFLNGYFIGGIPHFQTYPFMVFSCFWVFRFLGFFCRFFCTALKPSSPI